MSVLAPVFVGDLVRALSVAGLDNANWPAIIRMLGFQEGRTAQKPELDLELKAVPALPPLEQREESRKPEAAAPRDDGEIGQLLDFELSRSIAPEEKISFMPVQTPPSQARLLQFRSLFDAIGERGILLEAAGTPLAKGDLSLIRAVELIARGQALRDMPLETVRSTSKGCHILLDTGLGMEPFANDGRRLVRSLRRTVGAEHTRTLTFLDCPARGVMTGNYTDEQYTPPENGAVVLAISDLCCGGPRSAIREAEPQDWLSVAKLIQDAGSSLVVLNPYPSSRWPAVVAQQIPIVHWAFTTKATDVRRTRRRFRK